MKHTSRLAVVALATTMMLLGGSPGRATAGLVVSFDSSSHIFAGTIPSGSGPWAEAAFTRLGDHEVEVDFQILTSSVAGLYLDGAGFQFNTTSAPTFAHVGGATAGSTSFNSAGIALTGTGNEKFDVRFAFSNAANKRVRFGTDSVYDITFSSSSPVLAGDLSNLFRTPDASGHNDFAAAHLAGYNGTSAGIAGHIASVPEPSSLLTLGIGLSGLASAYAFRSRWTRTIHARRAEPVPAR